MRGQRMTVTLFIPCFIDALTTARFGNPVNMGDFIEYFY